MIVFNVPCVTGNEKQYVEQVLEGKKLSGDGTFNQRCQRWLEERFGCPKALLTGSATHALDMAALLVDIQPGDEVIMPSYTFCSTANAFALRGARIVFVDIRPDTMNIDEQLIEEAITPRTKAIVVVHYAGVACAMDEVLAIARRHGLPVVEDAAHAVMATYKGKALGTLGVIGCYSFHETKNYTCGEGGALLLNDARLCDRAEIIREKGTNRSQFFRGQIDKYSWVDLGSSYLLGELSAAFLYGQLEKAVEINERRLRLWQAYYRGLEGAARRGLVELPVVPEGCTHNGHLFYLKVRDLDERTRLIDHLKKNGIMAIFHYVPLHSAKAGLQFGRFHGADRHTTKESDRLLRLPLYYELTEDTVAMIVEKLLEFWK